MTKSAVAIAIALASLISLSSCANTANGLAKDGREASSALDASTHRILKAGAN
ncbi:entericidin [Rhizobium sp. R72]|uniref:entericidin n=1 Tax=unclassified Rhizobium TaxID=2613769 RepID=UPI000B535812|nr:MULTISPECIES: entericidin [unclassified Rhizobium]OWV92590.1 entericidin [Rhizobium sp. R693]OWW01516.1 entericidin [Rhizobium sp. R72]OWW01604.1 entericidin [Rhizobium sp. R711]